MLNVAITPRRDEQRWATFQTTVEGRPDLVRPFVGGSPTPDSKHSIQVQTPAPRNIPKFPANPRNNVKPPAIPLSERRNLRPAIGGRTLRVTDIF